MWSRFHILQIDVRWNRRAAAATTTAASES